MTTGTTAGVESAALPIGWFFGIVCGVTAGNGTVIYHLSVLQREGYIRSAVKDSRKLFWMKEEFPGVESAALHDISQRIVGLLEKHGKMSWSEIVSEFDASKPTVHKHIRELEGKDLVIVGSEGKGNYCELKREEMEYV